MKALTTFCLVIGLLNFADSCMVFGQEAKENISIVVNHTITTQEIDTERLKSIYTLNTQNWDDGNRIRLADYKGDNYLRIQFYETLGLTPSKIKKIWLRAQFTGKSIPPKVVNSISEMIEMVTKNPGTVGYLPSSRVTADMNVLFEIRNEL